MNSKKCLFKNILFIYLFIYLLTYLLILRERERACMHACVRQWSRVREKIPNRDLHRKIMI